MIRSAVVNSRQLIAEECKPVWEQLPNSLHLLHGRTFIEIQSLYVNDELKNLGGQTCAPVANICQKYSTRRH